MLGRAPAHQDKGTQGHRLFKLCVRVGGGTGGGGGGSVLEASRALWGSLRQYLDSH